jgi:hypothetical protein
MREEASQSQADDPEVLMRIISAAQREILSDRTLADKNGRRSGALERDGKIEFPILRASSGTVRIPLSCTGSVRARWWHSYDLRLLIRL